MKYLFQLFIIAYAQFIFPQQQQFIEPATIEIQYKFTMQFDTLTRNQYREDVMILRIGKNVSQFFNRNGFYGDSLANDPNGKKQWGQMMLQAIRQRNYDSMPRSKTINEYIYKNYPHEKITTTNQLLVDFYRYEEDYQPQIWQISDSVKQILDYSCQMATCDFRGRQWTAWFTPDIPISNGPWKFHGLPGLILEIYDKQRDYHYTSIGIQQNNRTAIMFYNFDEKKFIETNRISFLKAKRKLWDSNDPNHEIEAATGIDLSGGKASAPSEKKTNYEFIERDYR